MNCTNCLKKGKQIQLKPFTKRETPTGAGCVAVILIILGIPGLFFNGLGILLILAGILILSLGKKDQKVLFCPECRGERIVV
jgi:hypothetical protein